MHVWEFALLIEDLDSILDPYVGILGLYDQLLEAIFEHALFINDLLQDY